MAKNRPKKKTFKIPFAAMRKEGFDDWSVELALAFSAWADGEMLKKMKGKKIARVSEKVETAVRVRLDILAPYRAALTASLAYMAHPARSYHLPKMVWDTADAIWVCAGDTATDYNRYTKRFLLSGVLSATTLYWLNDSSKGQAKTREFLKKRIDNVLKVGKTLHSLKEKVRA